MKMYKPLPKVTKDQYETTTELQSKNYKLTEDSRLFRDKLASLLIKKKGDLKDGL